jgi:DNA-binding NarL/FixJ family response regulator
MQVLIAGKPGRMRESLTILLKMVDELDLVGQADDSGSAIEMISANDPALVLLDTNLPGEGVPAVLKQIRTNGASSCTLVLADGVQERRLAIAAGADAALIKGYRTAKLIEVVKGLLAQGRNRMGLETRGE